jgi:hypothetical protein
MAIFSPKKSKPNRQRRLLMTCPTARLIFSRVAVVVEQAGVRR